MRILHTVHSLDPRGGGVTEAIRLMSNSLAELGHSSTITTLNKTVNSDKNNFSNSNIEIIDFNKRSGKYGYSKDFKKWLSSNIQRYDAILIHGLWQYNSFGVYEYAIKNKIPYYIMTHGMLDPWFKHEYPIKHIKKYIYWLLCEHRVFSKANGVLYTTDQEKVLARQSFKPFEVKNEYTIGLGTQMPDYDFDSCKYSFIKSYPHLENKRFFLYLGRLHPKKGVDLLIEAYKKINPKEETLVIAGPTEDANYLTYLRKLAYSKKTFKNKIFFLPMLSDELKWGAIKYADVFVLPSHQENFAITVAEAIGSGAPVLTTYPVNTSEIIDKSDAGFVDKDSLDGVCRLLEKWISLTPSEKNKLRENTVNCFKESFSINQSTQRLVNIIKGCLN